MCKRECWFLAERDSVANFVCIYFRTMPRTYEDGARVNNSIPISTSAHETSKRGRKKKTTEQYINDAKLIWGDSYDYSLTEYNGSDEDIVVICPQHGEFTIRAASHLRGYGCPDCPKEKSAEIRKCIEEIGKKRRPIHKPYKHIPQKGDRFGLLSIICEVERIGRNRYVMCKCDCGNTKVINYRELRKGKISSCGCLASKLTSERYTTHGLAKKHPLYGVWKGIKSRCLNPKSPAYPHYGGRGISICEEWNENFGAFYKWCIDNGYNRGLSIDRIDNDGDYSPLNCRFADATMQARNKSNNKPIDYKNRHWHSLSSFCEEFDLSYSGVQSKLKCGWTIDAIMKHYGKQAQQAAEAVRECLEKFHEQKKDKK